jgi:anti-sigma B factor antagonist
MEKLELTRRDIQGGLVIDIVGELTVGSKNSLVSSVREQLSPEVRLLLLNLERCTRVDSSGLGELVTCLVAATRQGVRLLLVGVPQQIQGLMKITNLLQIFEIHDTESSALEAGL